MATLTIKVTLVGDLPYDLERDVLEALATSSFLRRMVTTMEVN